MVVVVVVVIDEDNIDDKSDHVSADVSVPGRG